MQDPSPSPRRVRHGPAIRLDCATRLARVANVGSTWAAGVVSRTMLNYRCRIGVAALWLTTFSCSNEPPPTTNPFPRPELIAHRGVHQTFPTENLEKDTCTAARIFPPKHAFLENTIPAIRAAFAAGATMVEIDIHRTADHHLVVFHDWMLDCRTNGRGVTRDHTLAELKALDVGYGYTSDHGQAFPFRGRGTGAMPTLDEVVQAFPEGRFWLNQKDRDRETARLLGRLLSALSSAQQHHFVHWGDDALYSLLHDMAPGVEHAKNRAGMKACAKRYLTYGWTGVFPDACANVGLVLPLSYAGWLWGWPYRFRRRAHHAGSPIFVAEIDTPQALSEAKNLSVAGWMTDRIEIIGPLLRSAPPELEAPTVTERPDLQADFRTTGVDGAMVVQDRARNQIYEYHPDRCARGFLPASTFKIANSIVGLETGVIPNPAFTLPWDGKDHGLAGWNRDHDMDSAIRFSAVWYFQEIARRIGRDRMGQWLHRLPYGNQTMGEPIDHFWLSGDLRITPRQQIDFLARLNEGRLPISELTRLSVREALVQEVTPTHVLRAKTGWAPEAQPQAVGWYVGWVELPDRDVYFATLVLGAPPAVMKHGRQAVTMRALRTLGVLRD